MQSMEDWTIVGFSFIFFFSLLVQEILMFISLIHFQAYIIPQMT
jgi:hypothetical protein